MSKELQRKIWLKYYRARRERLYGQGLTTLGTPPTRLILPKGNKGSAMRRERLRECYRRRAELRIQAGLTTRGTTRKYKVGPGEKERAYRALRASLNIQTRGAGQIAEWDPYRTAPPVAVDRVAKNFVFEA